MYVNIYIYIYIYTHIYKHLYITCVCLCLCLCMRVNQLFFFTYQFPEFPGHVPLQPVRHRQRRREPVQIEAIEFRPTELGRILYTSNLGRIVSVPNKQTRLGLYTKLIWVMNMFNGLI